jgi:hypothetical protein
MVDMFKSGRQGSDWKHDVVVGQGQSNLMWKDSFMWQDSFYRGLTPEELENVGEYNFDHPGELLMLPFG